jgi:hypothetical protein
MMSSPSRLGAVLISVTAQITFFLALVSSGAIAYFKGDYTLLMAMAGVAATNATTVVSYWVGSSDGSAKKTDIMAQNPLPAAPVVAVSGTTAVPPTTPTGAHT